MIPYPSSEDEEEVFGDGLLMREESIPIKTTPEWQTLSPDEISKKMFEIVDDVNAVFQVHHLVGVACHKPSLFLVTNTSCKNFIIDL